MADPSHPTTVLDAACAIASAAEANAVALIDAAVAVRQLVEHIREEAQRTAMMPSTAIH